MRWLRKLARVEKLWPLGIVGLILALAGTWIAIYYEKTPQIILRVVGDADVVEVHDVEVHQSLGRLKILFDGEAILEKGLNLKVLTVRVANDGSAHLLQQHYDDTLPWGLELQSGEIVNATVLSSNSAYLRDQFTTVLEQPPDAALSNRVNFPKSIIERDKYVTVKLTVLHPVESGPQMKAFGKIAGVDDLEVQPMGAVTAEPSIWSRVLSGNFLVHLLRFFGYVLAIVGLVLCVAIPASIIEKTKSVPRQRLAARYRQKYASDLNRFDDFLLKQYVVHGLGSLDHIRSIILNEAQLADLLRGRPPLPHGYMACADGNLIGLSCVMELMHISAIAIEEGKAHTDEDFRSRLNRLDSFVRTPDEAESADDT